MFAASKVPDYLAIQEDHLEELVDLEDLEDLEDLGVGDTELFSLFSRSFANERCVRSLNCVIALRAASSLAGLRKASLDDQPITWSMPLLFRRITMRARYEAFSELLDMSSSSSHQ